MNTAFILMSQYNAAIIPVDKVCADYFAHLTPAQFSRKVNAGDIDIVLTRIEASQKAATGVHLQDLATYIDRQRAAAVKENNQLWNRK